LKQLGSEILAAKYETQYSSWVFEEPDEIRKRESNIDSKWVELDTLSANKKAVLDDHLLRYLQYIDIDPILTLLFYFKGKHIKKRCW
jgi:hypothetical protein